MLRPRMDSFSHFLTEVLDYPFAKSHSLKILAINGYAYCE